MAPSAAQRFPKLRNSTLSHSLVIVIFVLHFVTICDCSSYPRPLFYMVVNKNGFDPFHKDAFGPTIDPSLFVPHSPATDSLFSIQCKLHLFCVKFHLGIPFHPTICVCVCFLIPVLISPI